MGQTHEYMGMILYFSQKEINDMSCNGKYDKAMELHQLQITYFKSIKTTSFVKVMRELRLKEQ